MSHGIKVSRDGYDIRTAGVLNQEFNSELNSLKIALEGLTTSTANGSRTVEITHGLGITPGFLVWFEVDSSGKWYSQYITEDYSGKIGNVQPGSNSTKLILEIDSSSSATIKVYYVLFYDPST